MRTIKNWQLQLEACISGLLFKTMLLLAAVRGAGQDGQRSLLSIPAEDVPHPTLLGETLQDSRQFLINFHFLPLLDVVIGFLVNFPG